MSKIYLVTHGQKEPGPDPGLTPEGIEQIKQLLPHLPKNFPKICCGTGKRFRQTAEALGVIPTRYDQIFGVPESRDRQRNVLIFADGEEIPYALYTGAQTRKPIFLNSISQLPAGSLVITGRPMMKALGISHPNPSTLYCFNLKTIKTEVIHSASAEGDDGE